MSDNKSLTEIQLFIRWKGIKALGTLRNWRSMGIGPKFVKRGGTPVYPLEEVIRYENQSVFK